MFGSDSGVAVSLCVRCDGWRPPAFIDENAFGISVRAHAIAQAAKHREAAEEASIELRQAKAALHKVEAELDARNHDLATRNTALRSLGQQLLKLREQLGAERERSEQLQVSCVYHVRANWKGEG